MADNEDFIQRISEIQAALPKGTGQIRYDIPFLLLESALGYLREGSTATINRPDLTPKPVELGAGGKPKRHRRTKLEMQAARAEEERLRYAVGSMAVEKVAQEDVSSDPIDDASPKAEEGFALVDIQGEPVAFDESATTEPPVDPVEATPDGGVVPVVVVHDENGEAQQVPLLSAKDRGECPFVDLSSGGELCPACFGWAKVDVQCLECDEGVIRR